MTSIPLRSDVPLRFGIDLGGTKIELVALAQTDNQQTSEILFRQRVPTPRTDYPATLAAIVGLVKAAETELGKTGTVGIGIPGAESLVTGLIKNANSTALNGHALRTDLEAALQRPVRIANDANCFTLSEAVDGSAAGQRVVFGVILGTGVGGGVVFDQHIWAGSNAIGGEWGHNFLALTEEQQAGQPLSRCDCGRLGCVESWLCGAALARDHAASIANSASPPAAKMDAPAIARAAEAGDPAAQATLERYAQRLAKALSAVINILDPNVIVLGGGLSNIKFIYERVPQCWGPFVFSDHVNTKLVPPRHGDSSGVRGAAWLWN